MGIAKVIVVMGLILQSTVSAAEESQFGKRAKVDLSAVVMATQQENERVNEEQPVAKTVVRELKQKGKLKILLDN